MSRIGAAIGGIASYDRTDGELPCQPANEQIAADTMVAKRRRSSAPGLLRSRNDVLGLGLGQLFEPVSSPDPQLARAALSPNSGHTLIASFIEGPNGARAYDRELSGNSFPLRDQRVGADQAIRPNPRAAGNGRRYAHKRVRTDRASIHDRMMADGNIRPDGPCWTLLRSRRMSGSLSPRRRRTKYRHPLLAEHRQ
jgi:hypothetical protein